MHKCRELSRLPKASKLRSLNFRRTTPGTYKPLLFGDYCNLTGPVDPTHPAAKTPQKLLCHLFPTAKAKGFALRAVPKALLWKVTIPWPDPPYSPAPARGPGSPRLNVSFVRLMSKSLAKSSVVRSKVGLKMKTAISLIVTRGADVETDEKGRKKIVFKEGDIGDKWILSEWTYIHSPTLEVYRMPYYDLIPALRKTLKAVKFQAEILERTVWAGRKKKPRREARLSPTFVSQGRKPDLSGLSEFLPSKAAATRKRRNDKSNSQRLPSPTSVSQGRKSNLFGLSESVLSKATAITKRGNGQSNSQRPPSPMISGSESSPSVRKHESAMPRIFFPSQFNYGPEAPNPLARSASRSEEQSRNRETTSSLSHPSLPSTSAEPAEGENREYSLASTRAKLFSKKPVIAPAVRPIKRVPKK
ncbi:uncharacterized protein LAESUDRAFT_681933 [Laetiporus sulphureus 93-53]|uniref:Uncharacterized protein n=1 Tax=Laetiporus sulphureus 93-53 TaxID=1314785 RepID=A0A165DH26_9APHY|nr:uncharacterized protein LAESUDRAFT_681933 [Laetiporus sulphureus 93-53]KZT04862.1 hypothetical protein LAESUDRAFT_681933 [Laetiporus sulphureus 93-53]